MYTLDLLKKLGAANDVEVARRFLERFDREDLDTPDESDDDGELLETTLLVMCINSSCWDHRVKRLHRHFPRASSDVTFHNCH